MHFYHFFELTLENIITIQVEPNQCPCIKTSYTANPNPVRLSGNLFVPFAQRTSVSYGRLTDITSAPSNSTTQEHQTADLTVCVCMLYKSDIIIFPHCTMVDVGDKRVHIKSGNQNFNSYQNIVVCNIIVVCFDTQCRTRAIISGDLYLFYPIFTLAVAYITDNLCIEN